MEHISEILKRNELFIQSLIMRNEEVNSKLDLFRRTLYEGYYDELGEFCITIDKKRLEEGLKTFFDAKNIEIKEGYYE